MLDQAQLPDGHFKPRRRWLAALLSLFWPGLGQLYAGSAGRACWCFFIGLGATALGLSTKYVPAGRIVIGLSIALIPIYLWNVIDAWRLAARRKEYCRRSCNKWWLYTSVIAVYAIINYAIQPLALWQTSTRSFYFPSHSMAPTTVIGDYLVADTFLPRLANIGRGDVILFLHDGQIFMKRVAGIPGDILSMSGGILTINGHSIPHDQPATLLEAGIVAEETQGASLYRESWPEGRSVIILQKSSAGPLDWFQQVTVPKDSFFVLGDTRDNSRDSRDFGFVSRDQLVGRATFVTWSTRLSRVGRLIN